MKLAEFKALIVGLPYGKRLPTAVYLERPTDWRVIQPALAATIERAIAAAKPDPAWNLLKLHTDQFAVTFLSYPDFDSDPHPPLAEATKIHLGTGSVVRTDYRNRPNPPILHRKETFISADDPRVHVFSALTAEEEAAGLYRDTSRIGLRLQWQNLLAKKGLAYEGHQLRKRSAPHDVALASEEVHRPVERHRTAIKRYDLSKPLKLALDRGILKTSHTFFDYGCGYGMDIEALTSLGFDAAGWDPAFRPNEPRRVVDVVNLGYVLNVIEEPRERIDALRSAFALASHALVVSTMVAGQETASHTKAYRDGFLTKSNTFQKFFAPGELESLIEETLQTEAITISMGVCVVFRNSEDAEAFEASRSRRRIDWSEISAQMAFTSPSSRERRRVDRYDLNCELFNAFWQCLLDFGRAPEIGEFPRLGEVRRVGGGLNRAINLTVQKNGEELWKLARRSREEDVLVYLAMTNFRRKFLRREIPARIKNDIRAFFGDLEVAKRKATELLFSAGDPGELELAIENLEFGHFDRNEMQFTFHRNLLGRLPPVLRVYVQCGAVRYGDSDEADLIKIHVRSGKLTFLHYDNFEQRKAPFLLTRIKINLRTQFVQVFDHRAENQPLENKKLFLHGTENGRLLHLRNQS